MHAKARALSVAVAISLPILALFLIDYTTSANCHPALMNMLLSPFIVASQSLKRWIKPELGKPRKH